MLINRVGVLLRILVIMLVFCAGCTAGSQAGDGVRELQRIVDLAKPTFTTEPVPYVFLPTTPVVYTAQPSIEASPTDPDPQAIEIHDPLTNPGVLVDVVKSEGWTWHARGKPMLAPVLLYHHIGYDETNNPYYLSPELFAAQLDWIVAQGYTTITPGLLAEALRLGAFLPAKPLLITFDDGPTDLYTNAFPAMQIRKLFGTAYLVGDCINRDGCIRTEEVWLMHAAGWAFGSHGMTHADLTREADIETEMLGSGEYLRLVLNVPIETFAYPYGAGEPVLFQHFREYGYTACMGIGDLVVPEDWAVYYISRLVIRNGMTADHLAQMIADAENRSVID